MSDLDTDFDSLATQINAKLKEAAAALREANELAEKAKLPGLIFTQFISENMRYDGVPRDQISSKCEELEKKYERIDVAELESAMEDGGWSTSSSYC
jgi:hypothetical protein